MTTQLSFMVVLFLLECLFALFKASDKYQILSGHLSNSSFCYQKKIESYQKSKTLKTVSRFDPSCNHN